MENNLPSCCLCLNSIDLLNIFDEECIKKNIAAVIAKHFWFDIKEDDFNKHICEICWSRVDDFHSFYTQVSNIHNKFYSNAHEIIKVEMDEGTVLNPCSEIQENIPATNLEKDAKSVEQICDIKTDFQSINVDDEESCDDNYKGNQSVNNYNIGNSTSEDDPNHFEEKSKPLRISRKVSNSYKKIKKSRERKDEENKQIQEYFSMGCEICSNRCATFQDIKIHFRKEHKLEGYLRCCNRKFTKRSCLFEHLQWHLNPEKFKCNLCNKVFSGKYVLLEHRKLHLNPEERKFKCNECSKSYFKKYLLEIHLTTHNIDKTILCSDCGKACRTQKSLEAHKKNSHGPTIHICDVCAKEFRSKSILEQHHKALHQNIELPKVQCQICGLWMKNKHCLRSHIVRHQESKVSCNICGKQSLNRKALYKHMTTVHSDKVYKCNLCEKTFKKDISLKEHMSTHTGIPLNSCPYCSKTFNSSSNMYSHKKKIHVKEWEEHERLKTTGAF